MIFGVVAALVLGGIWWASRPPADPRLRLGLAGPFTDSSLAAAQAAGVSELLVEVEWRLAEPRQGQLDEEYLRGKAEEIRELRAKDFRIALNSGVQDAPDWLLRHPDARFVNQFGDTYTERPVPNLVFGAELRPFAASYLVRLLERLGTDFVLIRVGGGPLGELSYPWLRSAQGNIENYYWAFDDNAMRTNPVPAWLPGRPSPQGEARTFLSWYLDALTEYQMWQISAVRGAGYDGQIAVLYPSHGMRPGDAEKAIATDLAGTSPAERSGEVQRGYDFARHISALSDSRTVVYGTWGENRGVVDYLARLAARNGHAVMAENAGRESQERLDLALRNAARRNLSAFYLIRASELTCHCDGKATLEGVGQTYRSLAERARRSGVGSAATRANAEPGGSRRSRSRPARP